MLSKPRPPARTGGVNERGGSTTSSGCTTVSARAGERGRGDPRRGQPGPVPSDREFWDEAESVLRFFGWGVAGTGSPRVPELCLNLLGAQFRTYRTAQKVSNCWPRRVGRRTSSVPAPSVLDTDAKVARMHFCGDRRFPHSRPRSKALSQAGIRGRAIPRRLCSTLVRDELEKRAGRMRAGRRSRRACGSRVLEREGRGAGSRSPVVAFARSPASSWGSPSRRSVRSRGRRLIERLGIISVSVVPLLGELEPGRLKRAPRRGPFHILLRRSRDDPLRLPGSEVGVVGELLFLFPSGCRPAQAPMRAGGIVPPRSTRPVCPATQSWTGW